MEEIRRTLVVSGKGREKISATLAEVKLAVEARGKIATEVQQEIVRTSSAVVDLLRSLNVKQLKTVGIQLRTYHDYIDGVMKQIEHRGSNTIIFNLPIDNAGVAIDEATKAGANRVDGITFNATDEAIDAAKQEALRKATIDAKTQAKTVLSTLDFTLQDITHIKVDRARSQEVKPVITRKQRRGSSATPPEDEPGFEMPVIAGEIGIDAAVTLEVTY